MVFSVSKIVTLAVLAGSMGANAHSWIDYVKVRGSPVQGFIRNYRGQDWDTAGHRIEDPTLEQPICSKFQLEKNQEGKKFPKLTASPSDTIDGFWRENGHISQPEPDGDSGQIRYFGTFSEEIPTLKTVLDWPEYNPGETQPGFALSNVLPFDDSTCYETNPLIPTPEGRVQGKACSQSFVIPEDIATDENLTVFWIWDFSGKNGNAQAHTEWYTSCLDIALVPKGQRLEGGSDMRVVEVPSKEEQRILGEHSEIAEEFKDGGLLTRSAKFAAALGAQV